jgi:hypothetical protein
VSPKDKKDKTIPLAGNVIETVFWDAKGYILLDFLPRKETISKVFYVQMLQKSQHALHYKHLMERLIILQHCAPDIRED